MFESIHLNTVVNSAAIYLFILVGIRLLGKKELGQISVADLVFIMLISEAVGDVMRASNDTLLGAVIAALTLMVMNRIFKIAMYRSEKFSVFMEGRPAILIRHGQLNKKEMKRNKIDLDDLEQAGREHGIGDISRIGLAILETDGKISILEKDDVISNSKMEE